MTGDTAVQAHFAINSYLVSLSAVNGTITSGGGSHTHGTEVTAEASNEEGYHFVKWTNAAGDSLSGENPYTFTVTGDTAVQAHFAINSYLVSLSAVNGTITSGGGSHTHGTEVTAEASNEEGYHFVKWTNAAGDSLSGENPYTFTVTGDTAVQAHFAINSYSVSLSAVNGTITSGDGSHTHGTEVTAEARNEEGYHFVKWTNAAGDSLSGENPYTFMVTGDTAVQAHFAINSYEVNLFATEHGRIASGDGTYTHGAEAAAEAAAYYGYHFIRWENAAGDSLSADNPYRFAVKGDMELTAVFSGVRRLVTAEASAGGRVTGGGYYDYGSQVTLTALPDSGYRFAKWTAGEKLVEQVGSTDSSYSFLLIWAAFDSYRANFVKEGGGTGVGATHELHLLPGVYYAEGVLHLVNLDGYSISVSTMKGERVLQFTADSDNAEQAAALPAGVYILNAAKWKEKYYVTKFVVK
ncbi:Listeria-Bacteroides repeat domain [Bacteroidales bacterium Barb4]|nr:Listeria-Bacteroides repeat domain [Bacteroidales bacterium Barb4]